MWYSLLGVADCLVFHMIGGHIMQVGYVRNTGR